MSPHESDDAAERPTLAPPGREVQFTPPIHPLHPDPKVGGLYPSQGQQVQGRARRQGAYVRGRRYASQKPHTPPGGRRRVSPSSRNGRPEGLAMARLRASKDDGSEEGPHHQPRRDERPGIQHRSGGQADSGATRPQPPPELRDEGGQGDGTRGPRMTTPEPRAATAPRRRPAAG